MRHKFSLPHSLQAALFWFHTRSLAKQYVIICIACSLLLGIAYSSVLKSPLANYQQLMHQQQMLAQQWQAQQQQIQQLPLLIKQTQQLKGTQQKLLAQFAQANTLMQQLDTITRLGLLQQQQFLVLRLATLQTQTDYSIQLITLSTITNFQHLCDFLAALAKLPILISFNHWQLQPLKTSDSVKNNNAEILRFDGTLQLYLKPTS